MTAQVRIRGLDELRAGLRQVDRRLPKAVGKANKKIGDKVVARGAPAIRGLPSPGGGKAMSGLKSSAQQKAVVIRLLGSNPTIRANVLGTLSHTVYGRTIPGRGPWKPWLGRSWKPEDLHGLGPVIRDVADNFALDEYLDAVMDALRPAFPN